MIPAETLVFAVHFKLLEDTLNNIFDLEHAPGKSFSHHVHHVLFELPVQHRENHHLMEELGTKKSFFKAICRNPHERYVGVVLIVCKIVARKYSISHVPDLRQEEMTFYEGSLDQPLGCLGKPSLAAVIFGLNGELR